MTLAPMSSAPMASALLARYRFTFRMHTALHLPEYAGSLLRGQFGAALRQVSCMTRQSSCEGCPLRGTCPYASLFEAPAPAAHALQQFSHIPNPYVIEPPEPDARRVEAGDTFSFAVVLIGQATAQLPLVSFALQQALEKGLGRMRASGTLESIEWQQATSTGTHPVCIWRKGESAIAGHAPHVHLPEPDAHTTRQLTLHMRTPMRLQQQGTPLRPAALKPRKLMADLLRRITLLNDFHGLQAGHAGQQPDVHALVEHAHALAHYRNLHWHDWSRYSSRQQREMTLGGVLGDWTLEGDIGPLLPWLQLGQWLHVGKNATMGLGHYTLTYS